MHIFLSESLRDVPGSHPACQQIGEILRRQGTVLTECSADGYAADREHLTAEEIYRRDLAWMAQSDIVVADVSVPSFGVGYEIAMAEQLGKRIICLVPSSQAQQLSAMIVGNHHLTVLSYEDLIALERELASLLNPA